MSKLNRTCSHSRTSSNRLTSPRACYRKHEKEKRRKYEERIHEVEHGTFTPLVFSATGGMGTTAEIFYKCLASLISEKNNQDYATTNYVHEEVHIKLSTPFSHSSLPADLVATEGRIRCLPVNVPTLYIQTDLFSIYRR